MTCQQRTILAGSAKSLPELARTNGGRTLNCGAAMNWLILRQGYAHREAAMCGNLQETVSGDCMLIKHLTCKGIHHLGTQHFYKARWEPWDVTNTGQN